MSQHAESVTLSPPASCRHALPAERAAALAIVATVVGFIALIEPAMRTYPGGTVWDPTTRGNDFWLNYLSDLQRTVALNGEPNRAGALYARAAMLLLALGLAPFWALLTRLFPERVRLGRAVRASGAVSVVGAVAACLLPSDRFAGGHAIAIAAGGTAGVIAAALATAGLARRGRGEWLTTSLGAATVAVSTADLLLYLSRLTGAFAEIPPIAVLERTSLLLVLAWMCCTARRGAAWPPTGR
ncbi:MAG: hypothetical protein ACRENE_12675 [Polyangiaceae bacterium]